MIPWERFLTALEAELGAEVVARWVRPLKVRKFDAANLYLEAENPLAVAWFEEHIRPRLRSFVNENHRPIRVHCQASSQMVRQQAPSLPLPGFTPSTLDPTHTLEHFVRAPGNEVAYELVSEWLQKRACPFNPLFLYGPKNAGKTHLLMSLAATLKNAFYVTANAFTEHVVQAIRSGRMQEFRHVYRDIDVLLVDDIQRLGGRGATQEEFFHTFNTLHTLGKPIVLTAPVPPSKLEEIEPRLISRFEWGLALPIAPLEPGALLRAKAALWHVELKEPIEQWLLEQFRDPLVPLQALALRRAAPASVEAAQSVLADLLRKEAEKALTAHHIVKALSAHFGVRPEDLLGKSQTRECALPRQLAMYVCRMRLKMPFQQIGKFFGRDHSTVMSSVKQVEQSVGEKKLEVLEAIEIASRYPKS